MNDLSLNKPIEEMGLPFQEPQRESDFGVLLNFFYLLYKWVRIGITFFLIFFLAIQKALDSVFYTISIGILLTLIFIAVLSVFAYLQYNKLLFHIDYQHLEFHIEKGVLQKTTLVFKLERIQQINIKRNWLQRILGLSSLEIETAGSTEKEVSLKSLSVNTANDLRQALMQPNTATTQDLKIEENEHVETVDEVATQEQIITKISLWKLIQFGISDNIFRGLLLIFIPVNYIYQSYSSYFLERYKEHTQDIDNFYESLTLLEISGIVFLLLLFSLLFNIVRAIFKYYGFTFTKIKSELKLNFGLFNLKSISLTPLRIQLLHKRQNSIQKYWSIVNYRVFQFNSLEAKDLSIVIPGLKTENQKIVDQYLQLPNLSDPENIVKPFKRMFFVHSIIYLALFLILGVSLSFYLKILPVLIGFVLFFPVVLFWNYKVFKNYQLEIHGGFLVKKSGFWKKETIILNSYKIQTILTKQYFWQKRLNMGKITFVTAGGNLDFKFADFQVLQQIQNECLYRIEAFPKKWM